MTFDPVQMTRLMRLTFHQSANHKFRNGITFLYVLFDMVNHFGMRGHITASTTRDPTICIIVDIDIGIVTPRPTDRTESYITHFGASEHSKRCELIALYQVSIFVCGFCSSGSA